MFIAAIVGLSYMINEIIDKFYNKDVPTEVRIDQEDSQQWPAITICQDLTLMKHFACINVNRFSNISTQCFSMERW